MAGEGEGKQASEDEVPEAAPSRPQEEYLLGTIFDSTHLLERTLSTGTTVRLRVEFLSGGRVMVHQAFRRRRGDDGFLRWRDVEGERSGSELLIDRFTHVD